MSSRVKDLKKSFDSKLSLDTPATAPRQKPRTNGNAPLGIHASVLFALARENPKATTKQVCEKFIKPRTHGQRCAYVDLMKDQTLPGGKPAVAPASCFVSHAWMCNFDDIVDVLYQHDQKYPDTYFWFDLVCNNQHGIETKPFEWFCTTFKESIRDIGSVLLMMTPWDDPIPLRRVWCLFEMYSTIDVQADMHIAIPSSQREAFKAAIGEDFDAIMNVLIKLDGRKAEASEAEDRRKIFTVVEMLDGGFATLNNAVKNHLRQWYLKMCVELAEDAEDGDMLYNIANAIVDFGDQDGALPLFELALRMYRAQHGESSPEVARTYNCFGLAYKKKGEYDKALQYYEKCLAIYLATLGENHPDTATTYNAIGIAYKKKGEYDKALQYYEKDLAITLATIGENHPDTACTYNAMGDLYEKGKKDNRRAAVFFQKAVRIFMATLGADHPNTAMAQRNLNRVQ